MTRSPMLSLTHFLPRIGWAVITLALVIGAFIVGRGMHSGAMKAAPAGASASADAASSAPQVWTCSMHPQIRLPNAGQCPICFMDLIPLRAGADGDPTAPVLTLSSAARALAEIETSPAERRAASVDLRMVGLVEYDVTRVQDVAMLSEGQVDRLFVQYVGAPVKKGEHLATFYSPQVLTAGNELVAALSAPRPVGLEGVMNLADVAQQRLHLLGVPQDHIDHILRTQTNPRTYTIYSPIDGVIRMIEAHQGHWLDTGEDLVEIVDTSRMWIMLDAYERDLPFIRYGQHVDITVDALPGRVFEAFVAFIPPELDPRTRTAKVRLTIANPDGELRQGMFVRASLKAGVRADASVYAPDLTGVWVCPMHPEVQGNQPGSCDLCGMALVSASTDNARSSAGDPLLIPSSAPLVTGRRAVVYVERAPGEFEGREIKLGLRVGDRYVVLDGLNEGERVVTRGNFKIDSALQIEARNSLMSPGAPEPPAPASIPARLTLSAQDREAARPVWSAAFALARALAKSDLDAAQAAATLLDAALSAAAPSDPLAREAVQTASKAISPTAAHAEHMDLDAIRAAFRDWTAALVTLADRIGPPDGLQLHLQHCPMAFNDEGGDWLLDQEDILNPYYGSMMLRCGEIVRTIEPSPSQGGAR